MGATGTIIMSTRTNTRKYENLVASPHVSMLFHDFPQTLDDDGRSGSVSVTIDGELRVLVGDEAEAKRKLHVANDSGYEQFILGPDIAVLAVKVLSARICNIRDEVDRWAL